MAQNKVIAGDYNGSYITFNGNTVSIGNIVASKGTIRSIDVMSMDQRKSASSSIVRGALGAAVLGPVGVLAGLSGKNKTSITAKIRFTDGKQSLVDIDDRVYKLLLQATF